jgi:hypothetical protein
MRCMILNTTIVNKDKELKNLTERNKLILE